MGYYKEPSLPIGQNWLDPLWGKCLEVMPKTSKEIIEAKVNKCNQANRMVSWLARCI